MGTRVYVTSKGHALYQEYEAGAGTACTVLEGLDIAKVRRVRIKHQHLTVAQALAFVEPAAGIISEQALAMQTMPALTAEKLLSQMDQAHAASVAQSIDRDMKAQIAALESKLTAIADERDYCRVALRAAQEVESAAVKQRETFRGQNTFLSDECGVLREDLTRARGEVLTLRERLEHLERKLSPPPKPQPLLGSTWKRRPI